MNPTNQTVVTYFIIKGISDVPEFQAPIFGLVLLMYLTTLCGNFTILLLVCLEPKLHSPMYFFLGNLSFMDMSSTTSNLNKVLTSFVTGVNTISLLGCFTQCYIFTCLAGGELLILTAMSYDRYVAICNPFHYQMVMNPSTCVLLATACWLGCFIEFIPHVVSLFGITCFQSREVNHFFCDIVALQKLACGDTSFLDASLFCSSTFHATFTLFLTFIPYFFIISTILRINSSIGKRKAFYTCSSHLTVVILLYATLISQYLIPASVDSLETNKLFSLFNTAAVPMLNPLIYSLKNESVKTALRSRFRRFRVIT
ncbi:olfactory receptor 5V1-like [Discoglossus pictus]